MTYLTKDNRTIKIIRSTNFEPDDDRGWVVHAGLAYVDNEPAGYIKISFIPKEKFDKLFPTIFHYLRKMKGIYHYSKAITSNKLEDWYDALITDTYNFGYFSESNEKGIELDIAELKKRVSKLKRHVAKKYRVDYESFKHFHIDRPMVDFIRVYSEHDQKAFGTKVDISYERNDPISFQRLGIGTALYEEAARWMSEQGLKLYASGLQEPNAAMAWKNMQVLNILGNEEHVGYQKKVVTRYYLDGATFPPEHNFIANAKKPAVAESSELSLECS